MPSRIGFYFFAGLLVGTFAGHFLFELPAYGAVVLGVIGLALAIFLDRKDEKKIDEQNQD